MSVTLSRLRLIAQATRLTQGGHLQEATAAIRAALGRDAPASSDAAVIDVEAREVREAESPAPVEQPAGRFIAGSHTQAASTREYKLYLPPGAGERPMPLVVMLHGCTQDPDDFAAGTRMNELARQHGVIVLYPAQAQRANSSRCWNWFKHNHQKRDRGEPALLAGMTRDIIARYNVDAAQVFVTGLSAGGAMAAILGSAYPDLFAAVGVHSGLVPGAANDVNSAFAAMRGGAASPAALSTPPPPTIVFHGDQDATVNPVNGEQVVAAATKGLKADPQPAQASAHQGWSRRVYRDAQGRPRAEHWLVHGAGHAWSGGSAAGSYTDEQGPDASAEMLRFFLSVTRA